MSDTSSERITIRIPEELGGRLRYRSRTNGQTGSDLVRAPLQNYLGAAEERILVSYLCHLAVQAV